MKMVPYALVFGITLFAASVIALFTIQAKTGGNGCLCQDYTCGCCVHMDVDLIELNSTLCSNFTYLRHDYGLSFTITLNQHTLFNETVSARNPPPYCVGPPFVKEYAEICVRFYNLNTTRHSFYGCLEADAKLKHIRIARYDIGCFSIGPKLKYDDEDNISVVKI
ncbi:uncharacterized protein LOC132203549 [Neocloeon triangulifer]|uniref:uncharacterized protein LOC132203549 n=1 Tax=Neocloeon triangulifer TaxID=2078957 RepID=UPI00286F83DC|nr:uncharacterized protein LOC132203549 [Neocloeon triangulifer]XP_059487382.1 uncharacterized protein LOC132203549 [Neocloeon triangulifer]